jgi:hypothetical protein
MKDFHIFVEGEADRKFLHDYIETTFGTVLNAEKNSKGGIKKSENITTTDGWTGLNSSGGGTFREKMKENTQKGILNLIIFDADTPEKGGGIIARKNSIKESVKDSNRDFKNTQHWNLNAPALDALKEFLRRHLD